MMTDLKFTIEKLLIISHFIPQTDEKAHGTGWNKHKDKISS
jgi:hypothetical protein